MEFKDMRRLFDGEALVAREATRYSSSHDILRSALFAATDLAGLTRGTQRWIQPVPFILDPIPWQQKHLRLLMFWGCSATTI